MNLLKLLMRYSWSKVFLGILIGLTSGAAYTGLITVTHKALDSDAIDRGLIVTFLVLCLVMPLTRSLAQILLAFLGQQALADLRVRMSRKILATPLRQLEEIGIPKLLASITQDAIALSNAMSAIPLFFMHLAIVLGCLTYMLVLSWQLFAGVLGVLIVGMGTYQFGVARGGRYFRRAREVQDRLFEHIRALTSGAKELKLHHRRSQVFLNDVLQPTTIAYRRHQVSAISRLAFAGSWLNLLYFAALGMLLFVAPTWAEFPVVTLAGFVMILLFMAISVDVLMQTLPNLVMASIALYKIEQLGLSLASEDKADFRYDQVRTDWRRLELAGTVHTYKGEEDQQFSLGPIDLSFEAGEFVFITGGNGSGKTTLAKLLTGLYAPEAGEVRLDGETVDEESREAYRQLFSVIFSDFYLFDSLLGLEEPQLDGRARHYLEKLHLDHKVRVSAGELSAIELSSGQRKRLALLTAYLEDRPIYVFDEWAADQDPQFREIFYLELLPELRQRGKTVLVISHDDRYYGVADRLIRLTDGQVEFDRSGSELAAYLAGLRLGGSGTELSKAGAPAA